MKIGQFDVEWSKSSLIECVRKKINKNFQPNLEVVITNLFGIQ